MRYFAILDDPDSICDVATEQHILAEFADVYNDEADACTGREGDLVRVKQAHDAP